MPKISSCFDDTPRRRCRPSSAPQRPSPCSAAKRSVGFIVTTLLVLAGCTLSRAPDLSGGEAAPDPDLTVPNFTEMALLLLLADRLTYEPFSPRSSSSGGSRGSALTRRYASATGRPASGPAPRSPSARRGCRGSASSRFRPREGWRRRCRPPPPSAPGTRGE